MSADRRRRSNVRQYSAEDQALTNISKEEQTRAESRLAAKRAAREEAKAIRSKEIERQQKEADEKEKLGTDSSDTMTRSRQQTTSSAISSRRGSDESSEGGEGPKGERDLRHEVRALEDKYKAAMMSSAQLDNEKQSLVYQVELLKDQLEEHLETHTELQREYKDKNRELELTKRELTAAQQELKTLREMNDYKDRLIAESGLVIVAAENGDLALERSGEAPSTNGPVGAGGLLLSSESLDLLNKSGQGSLGTHSLASSSASHTTHTKPDATHSPSVRHTGPSHRESAKSDTVDGTESQETENAKARSLSEKVDEDDGSSVDGPMDAGCRPSVTGGQGVDSEVCGVSALSEAAPSPADDAPKSGSDKPNITTSKEEANRNEPQMLVESLGNESQEGESRAESAVVGMLMSVHDKDNQSRNDNRRNEAGEREENVEAVTGKEVGEENSMPEIPSVVVTACSHSQSVSSQNSEEEGDEFFDAVSTPVPSPNHQPGQEKHSHFDLDLCDNVIEVAGATSGHSSTDADLNTFEEGDSGVDGEKTSTSDECVWEEGSSVDAAPIKGGDESTIADVSMTAGGAVAAGCDNEEETAGGDVDKDKEETLTAVGDVDKEETAAGKEDKEETPGVDVEKEETAGGDADKQTTGGDVAKEETPGGDGDKQETPGGDADKQETPGGDVAKEETAGGDITKEETAVGDVTKEETAGGDVVKQETTGGDVEKEEATGGDADKQETTGGDVAKEETAGGHVDKQETTGGDGDKEETPVGDVDEEETPGGGGDKEEAPVGDVDKAELLGGGESQCVGADVQGVIVVSESAVHDENERGPSESSEQHEPETSPEGNAYLVVASPDEDAVSEISNESLRTAGSLEGLSDFEDPDNTDQSPELGSSVGETTETEVKSEISQQLGGQMEVSLPEPDEGEEKVEEGTQEPTSEQEEKASPEVEQATQEAQSEEPEEKLSPEEQSTPSVEDEEAAVEHKPQKPALMRGLSDVSEDSEAKLGDDGYDFDDIDDALEDGSPAKTRADKTSTHLTAVGGEDATSFGSRDSGLQESIPAKDWESSRDDTVSIQSRDSGTVGEDDSFLEGAVGGKAKQKLGKDKHSKDKSKDKQAKEKQGKDKSKEKKDKRAEEKAKEKQAKGASKKVDPKAASRESLDLEAKLDSLVSQEAAGKDEHGGKKQHKPFGMFKKIFNK